MKWCSTRIRHTIAQSVSLLFTKLKKKQKKNRKKQKQQQHSVLGFSNRGCGELQQTLLAGYIMQAAHLIRWNGYI